MELQLTEGGKEHFRQAFSKRDRNGDGRIKRKDLADCMRDVGYFSCTVEDEQFLYNAFDTDGDGTVSIEELIDNVDVIIAHSINKDELVKCFEKLHKDGKGFIGKYQLRTILSETGNNRMSKQEAAELVTKLFDEFDTNKDGRFSYPEFVRMVMQTDTVIDGGNI